MNGPNQELRFSIFPPGPRWLPVGEVAPVWEFEREMERDYLQELVVQFDDTGLALPSTFMEPNEPVGPFRREAFDRRRIPIGRYSTWHIYSDLGPSGLGLA